MDVLDELLKTPELESQDVSSTLRLRIADLISDRVLIRDTPYFLGEGVNKEIDPDSVDDASEAIVKMLGDLGLLSDF